MENHLTMTELRQKARDALRGNWTVAVLSNLIVGIILGIVPTIINASNSADRISIFRNMIEDGSFSYRNSIDPYEMDRLSSMNTSSNLISFIIGLLITGALTYGLSKVFLSIKRGNTSNIEMIFDGFKKYKETFLINLLLVIFQFLWGLLWGVGVVILILIGVFGGIALATGGTSLGGVGVIFFIILLALGISYSIFINRYSMTYFIALDNEGIGSMEALEESIRIMKGNQIRYFLLQLTFIGWFILGLIPCCIGLLWVIPYIKATKAAFYDDLIGRNEKDFDFRLME
ncbi:Uncharacterized membrane protein [Clostridium cavendishii DSM 21758]|uniref:Uncharacterized membrane protein n=1 Tax=Clostridium cavendishii DSM 21758 TaxID=1121302 RepID=A0A1M6E9X3_9CLOT|nr:DUF975 family protein [Clostridium cavendishii]SHI82272.1 Uncharacterized membrane protein [Clostridium cavendishii DSM 21758]